MTLRFFLTSYFLLVIFLFSSCKKSTDTTTNPVSTKYFPLVKTIIQNNCLSCHSSSGSWVGRPTTFDTDSSIVGIAANIKASVVDPVTPMNRRMPQTGSLSTTDINTIVSWYNAGGKTNN